MFLCLVLSKLLVFFFVSGYQEAAPMLAGMGLPTQSHDTDPTFKWLEGEKRVRFLFVFFCLIR